MKPELDGAAKGSESGTKDLLSVPKGWKKGEDIVIGKAENIGIKVILVSLPIKPLITDRDVSPDDIAYIQFYDDIGFATWMKWWFDR